MGKLIRKFLIVFIIFIGFSNNSNANVPYFLDFKYILNQSDAGKKAQDFLKKKLESGLKNISTKEYIIVRSYSQ